jgi:hypothetical protein
MYVVPVCESISDAVVNLVVAVDPLLQRVPKLCSSCLSASGKPLVVNLSGGILYSFGTLLNLQFHHVFLCQFSFVSSPVCNSNLRRQGNSLIIDMKIFKVMDCWSC